MSLSQAEAVTAPRPQPASPALELHEVSRRYGRHWALVRLSFTLPRGSSLLLTGHNGSGKTTLLRLIATAMPPSSGQLKILGRDAVRDRDLLRRDVALLSHQNFLYEDLSAAQNLELFAKLLGLTDPARRVQQVLEQVSLRPGDPQPVRQYSAGMRKRAAVARVLLKEPQIALLDEPFGELDPKGIEAMEGFIRDLSARGCTVLLSTHHVEQGKSLCRQHLHLEQGRAAVP